MANINFSTGNLSNLPTTKKQGNVYFAVDSTNKVARIYFDSSDSERVYIAPVFSNNSTTSNNLENLKLVSDISIDATGKLSIVKFSGLVGNTNKPIYFDAGKPTPINYEINANITSYSGSLSTDGWKTLHGTDKSPVIAISYNNSAAIWNSGTYSTSLVWGCADTRGLLDCAYNKPIITFGGSSFQHSTDSAPQWYMKIAGTAAKTYDLENLSVNEHTHNVTYTPTGNVSNIALTPSGSVTSTFTNTAHTHKFSGVQGTTSGASTAKSFQVVNSVGTLPTKAEVALPNETHKHVYEKSSNVTKTIALTPSGSVTSTFTGKAENHSHYFTAAGSTEVINEAYRVQVLSSYTAGTLPTRQSVSLPNNNHTHSFTPSGATNSVYLTPSGTVTSTFSGTSQTPSGTVSMSSTISDYEMSISATFSGNSQTPSGTVASTFSGTSASHSHTFTGSASTTGSADSTNRTSVYEISSVGTLPSVGTTYVSSTAHIHEFTSNRGATENTSTTPSGNITSTFTGTSASHSHGIELTETNTTVPNKSDTSVTKFYQITDVGSLPTTLSVTVSGSDHTHTLTPTGTNESIMITGSVASEFKGISATHNHTFTGVQNTITTTQVN